MRRTIAILAALAGVLVIATSGSAAQGPAAPCPARAPSSVDHNPWAPAQRQLVPPGAVALRLCRYAGLNDPLPLTLTRSRLLTTEHALIVRLARELDALPPLRPGLFACPADDGSEVVAMFAYAPHDNVTVAFETSGCARVSNGDLVRSASAAQPLHTELSNLTAPLTGDARVAGRVRLCGGPLRPGGRQPGCSSRDGAVTVLDSSGDVVAAAATSHGRFSFALPAGAYTLLAATGGTRAQRAVVLTAGRTVNADVTIAVP